MLKYFSNQNVYWCFCFYFFVSMACTTCLADYRTDDMERFFILDSSRTEANLSTMIRIAVGDAYAASEKQKVEQKNVIRIYGFLVPLMSNIFNRLNVTPVLVSELEFPFG